MKKFLSVVAAIAAVTATVVGFSAAPSSADATTVVDVSTTVTASPSTVSPPGADVIYRATYTNSGIVAVASDLTDATGNGTFVSATSSAPGCTTPDSTTNPKISCTVSIPPGGSVSIQVVIQTPATSTGSAVTNTSTIAVAPSAVGILDLTPGNNQATVTTQVAPSTSSTEAAAFVPQGGSLQWRKHVLTVEQAALGVLAHLSDSNTTNLYCGSTTTPCGSGLHAQFDQGGDGQDFYGLMRVDVNFGTTDPCRGIGADKCHPLYVYKGDPNASVRLATTVPNCDATEANRPCLRSVSKSATNEFHYIVVLDTNDPDLATLSKSLIRG